MAQRRRSAGITVEAIEELVRGRRKAKVISLIPAYLKKCGRDPEAVFQACDWYRRLGLFREGLRLLDLPTILKPESGSRRRSYWAARLLNSLGATEFAVDLVNRFSPGNHEECRIAGNIYLSAFDSEKALPILLRMEEVDPTPDSYSHGWLAWRWRIRFRR